MVTEPGVDGIALLKVALRAHGLRCVAIRGEPAVLDEPTHQRIARVRIGTHPGDNICTVSKMKKPPGAVAT